MKTLAFIYLVTIVTASILENKKLSEFLQKIEMKRNSLKKATTLPRKLQEILMQLKDDDNRSDVIQNLAEYLDEDEVEDNKENQQEEIQEARESADEDDIEYLHETIQEERQSLDQEDKEEFITDTQDDAEEEQDDDEDLFIQLEEDEIQEFREEADEAISDLQDSVKDYETSDIQNSQKRTETLSASIEYRSFIQKQNLDQKKQIQRQQFQI